MRTAPVSEGRRPVDPDEPRDGDLTYFEVRDLVRELPPEMLIELSLGPEECERNCRVCRVLRDQPRESAGRRLMRWHWDAEDGRLSYTRLCVIYALAASSVLAADNLGRFEAEKYACAD